MDSPETIFFLDSFGAEMDAVYFNYFFNFVFAAITLQEEETPGSNIFFVYRGIKLEILRVEYQCTTLTSKVNLFRITNYNVPPCVYYAGHYLKQKLLRC